MNVRVCPTNRLLRRESRLGGCLLALLVVVGCDSSPQLEDVAATLREQARREPVLYEVENVELVKQEQAGDPPVWKIDVKLTARLQKELFEALALDDLLKEYGYDAERVAAAQKIVPTLRAPESDELPTQTEAWTPPRAIVRKKNSIGDKFSATSRVTAERHEGRWKYFGGAEGLRLESGTLGTISREDLPQGALIVEENGDNPLKKFVAARHEFAAKVLAIEKKMQERLRAERTTLGQAIDERGAWSANVVGPKGTPRKLRFTFVGDAGAEGEVIVAVEDPSDAGARATLSGTLELPRARSARATEREPDGWMMRLKSSSEVVVESGSIRCGADGGLVWRTARSAVPLMRDKTDSPPRKLVDQLAVLKSRIGPGRVWLGQVQMKGDISYDVRLTFMEVRDDGKYVRAIVERPDEPFTVAVFEGTLGETSAEAYGWPLRLVRKSGQGPFGALSRYPLKFISQESRLDLAFPADDEAIGAVYVSTLGANRGAPSGVLHLKAVEPIAEFQPGPARWRKALSIGTRWTGTIERGAAPAERTQLTVCEVREEGRSYRLTLQSLDDPQRFRTFVGTLDDSQDSVDGYALACKCTSIVSNWTRPEGNFGGAYQQTDDAKVHFRLTTDGKTLLANPFFGERITLTADSKRSDQPLDAESLAAAWREACAINTRWSGILATKKGTESVTVELEFSSGVDAAGNVKAVIRYPAGNVSIPLEGSLALRDEDPAGFALKLEKKGGGKLKSVVFNGAPGYWLYFRLSDDRSRLIGMAGSPPWGWAEDLELRRGVGKTSK